MDNPCMKTSTLAWSAVFGTAIVASAFLLRGATEYWVESALIVAALALVILRKKTA
jgi:hypothetical protein